MQEESITITYTLKLTKDRIDEDSTDLTWRDNVWKSLLMMKNVDDEVIIDSGSYMNETLKEFAKTTAQDVNMAFVAEAVTRAMLSPTFKELNQKKSQILRMSSKIPEVIVS
tara:strand:+ start:255 stop:587 length:333 start_codon:yes stop_codon:yes gene_type:complete